MIVEMKLEKSTEGTHVYSGPFMRSLYINRSAPIFANGKVPSRLRFTIEDPDLDDKSKMEEIG